MLAASGLAPAGAHAVTQRLVVIVHRTVTETDLSWEALQGLVLGNRRYWRNGERVELFVHSGRSAERAAFVEQVSQMSETRFRQYWIGMVFRGRATSPPRPLGSSEALVAAVGAIPGAMAIVDAAAVNRGVRVVTLGGRSVEQPQYPLR
jgi:hypothetical protein